MKREELLFGGLLLVGVVIVVALAFFLSPDEDRPGVWGDGNPKATFAAPQGVAPRERTSKAKLAEGERRERAAPVDLSSIQDPEKRERVEKLLDGGKWIRVVDGTGGYYYTRPVTLHSMTDGTPHKFRVNMRPGLLQGGKRIDPGDLQSP